jgi:hypothetical protein
VTKPNIWWQRVQRSEDHQEKINFAEKMWKKMPIGRQSMQQQFSDLFKT